MKIRACIALAGLTLNFGVQGASFDCAKAQAKVEKLICESEALSAMDEKLAEAYQAALKQTATPVALKQRQQSWLKDLRQYCKTVTCLEGSYWARIRELEDGQGAKVYDTPELKIRREADKAAKVKEILAQHPLRLYEGTKEKNRAFCQGFYDALRTASPKITYIEPVFRTDDPTHPALGEYLACDLYEPKTAYVYFDLDELGRRGFKLYRVNVDGNPKNDQEEYLYGEDPLSQFNTFPAQLLAVNFRNCTVKNRVPATNEHPVQSGDVGIGFSALIRFQHRLFFYDLSRVGTEGGYYRLDLSGHTPHGFSPQLCSWKVPHNQ